MDQDSFMKAMKSWLVEAMCDAKEFHDDGTPKMGKFETEQLFREGLAAVGGLQVLKEAIPDKRITVGTHLFTRDGRTIGNAIVQGVRHSDKLGCTVYNCETDYGNSMTLTRGEVCSMFYVGDGNYTGLKEWEKQRKRNWWRTVEPKGALPDGFEWVDKVAMVRGEDFTYTADVLCSFPKKSGKIRYIVEDNGRIFIQRREQLHFVEDAPLQVGDESTKTVPKRPYPEWTYPFVRYEGKTYKHKKSGGEYILMRVGRMQTSNWINVLKLSVDMMWVAIYTSKKDGSWWVRPWHEFIDGRFEEIE